MSVGVGWNHGDMGLWLEVSSEAKTRSSALAFPSSPSSLPLVLHQCWPSCRRAKEPGKRVCCHIGWSRETAGNGAKSEWVCGLHGH